MRIFGVYGKGFDAARLVHPGLWALNIEVRIFRHSIFQRQKIYLHKGMGLVSHVFAEEDLKRLKGHLAIGHNRYSTSGDSVVSHAQPILEKITAKRYIALAHNGNLPSTKKLEAFLKEKKISLKGLNDSQMMTKAIAFFLKKGDTLEDAVKKSYPLFTGVFVSLAMDEKNSCYERYLWYQTTVYRETEWWIYRCIRNLRIGHHRCDILAGSKTGELVVINDLGIKVFRWSKEIKS
jgi:glutamine phosphoribosylpyrophosphate amidotransferase